jgi:hypothetical protein
MGLSPVVIPAVVYAQSKEGDEPERNLVTFVMQKDTWRAGDKDPKVDLSIGKDNQLWIRTNDNQWKRVVTE